MIEHLTFMNFTNENTEEQKIELINKIKAFKEEIPGVVDAQAGFNFAEGFGDYEFGLSVRFEDRKSFDDYMKPHPKHQEVGELMQEMGMADIAVVDYEM